MAYAQKSGKYFRAFYKDADGEITSSRFDDDGNRFTKKTDAVTWGRKKEVEIQLGLAAKKPEMSLRDWFNIWWPGQDLGLRSRANYDYLFDAYVLPEFGHIPLNEIKASDVNTWELRLIAAGYKRGGVASGARTRLITLLGDAVTEGLLDSNPALRPQRRGRRSGAGTSGRGQEKAWATPLQALLIAERAAILSGRSDDFVMLMTIAFGGLRWGEAMGLQPDYVRAGRLRIDQQLVEFRGKFYALPPKDDSNRDIDIPPFLAKLLAAHLEIRGDKKCEHDAFTVEGQQEQPCQGGHRFIFLGPNKGHIRNSNYIRRIFDPATDGWHPAEKGSRRPREARPVLVDGNGVPWPGKPKPSWPRAGDDWTVPQGPGQWAYNMEHHHVACWLPIVEHLTPHGLRHSCKTWMADLGIPEVLQAERMGHTVPGMRGVYTHVSQDARDKLKDGLEQLGQTALAERAAYGTRSQVLVLDKMLDPFRRGKRIPAAALKRRGVVVPMRRRKKSAEAS